MNFKKSSLTLILFILFLGIHQGRCATWEKLFSKKGPDCFRNVHELSNGDFIATGYTNNLNDTNGLVMRMDDDGDSLWAYTYNGPSGDDDIFLKGIPTSDGGFIVCGYSGSFGSHENAIYLKLNSSGQLQWVKNWGGSGYDRAKDIIQLSDGNYIVTGYTNSPPAQNYDAFIMKLDGNGNTIWNKIYGGPADDEGASLQLLPDGGFIIGGEGNEDFFIVRTDENGDSLWTRYIGTSGIEVLKALIISPGGNGFALSGTTTGVGAGGEDAYLVKTDTFGIQLWAKHYGGLLDDGFQGINTTSDGGYIGIGTTRLGPWPNPNIWLFKLDAAGNISWQNYFGGDEHDHGYTACETSDGGYIVGGHSHSFADNDNLEDAMLIKTNSTGQVNTPLTYTTITDLISPVTATCGITNVHVQVEITNYSDQTVANIPVTVQITGAITQTLTQTYSSAVARNGVKTLTFSTAINMSNAGTYNFHCFTGNPHDVYPPHNFLNKTIVISTSIAPVPTVNSGTHCGPGSVDISASSPQSLNWFDVSSGGVSLFTGSIFSTPYLTADEIYYVEAGTTCPGARVPVNAGITPGLTPPVGIDSSRCAQGSVTLNANSIYQVSWYDSPTSLIPIFSGYIFNTPSLNSNSQYFISAENASCTSTRVPVNAVVNPRPDDPLVIDGYRCGNGSVELHASAVDSILWYDSISGINSIGSGNIFTTPDLTTSTAFYAQTNNGICNSNLIAVSATINPSPIVNFGSDTIYTSQNSYLLDAGSGYSTYAWSTTDITQTLLVQSPGNYCVIVNDLNDCSDTSCVFVEFTTGMNDPVVDEYSIYPNPVLNLMTIEMPRISSEAFFKVFDLTGRLIFSTSLFNATTTIDVSSFSNGIYIAVVSDITSIYSRKFTVEK